MGGSFGAQEGGDRERNAHRCAHTLSSMRSAGGMAPQEEQALVCTSTQRHALLRHKPVIMPTAWC